MVEIVRRRSHWHTHEPYATRAVACSPVELQLHNTLSGERETFVPLDPDRRTVSFYSCGPTVYDYAHIGNFRSFLNADVLRRTLELLGFEVVHVDQVGEARGCGRISGLQAPS